VKHPKQAAQQQTLILYDAFDAGKSNKVCWGALKARPSVAGAARATTTMSRRQRSALGLVKFTCQTQQSQEALSACQPHQTSHISCWKPLRNGDVAVLGPACTVAEVLIGASTSAGA
jgi:hypothetical protein